MNEPKSTGLTKDAGFQIGARRTFPISIDTAWDYLFSKEGVATWLGEITAGNLELKNFYHTKDGGEGQVRTLKTLSHIRLTWKKKRWPNSSSVQVRIIKAKDKATISFHQDNLLNSEQRDEMHLYWNDVLDRFTKKFS